MEEMKWFSSSAMLGVLAANNLGIVLPLRLESADLLASSSTTLTWHVQNMPNRTFSTL
jgi:hypothetical protein